MWECPSMPESRPRIDDELVDHLEWLARVKLSPGERERLKRELELLLDYFSQVVEHEPPEGGELLYPNPSGRLRDDVPEDRSTAREHIANALVEEGYVRAPRVVKG